MNIEKFNRILDEVLTDEAQNEIITKLNQFVTSLSQIVSNPTHQQLQDNFKNNIETLNEALDNSEYNNYPNSWIEILEEVSSGEFIFGDDLKFAIESVLGNNTLTPANALKEITAIQKNVTDFYKNAREMFDSMQEFNIDFDTLESGQCELSYMIPREYIDNNLDGYDKEIGTLKYIINTITEAVTGEKHGTKIKSISSSELFIYLSVLYVVAEYFLDITNKILEVYERILAIKIKTEELKQMKLPKKAYEAVDKTTEGLMEKEIEKMANNIIKDFKGDSKRKNEIKNGLNSAIQKLAKRIDNGFKVEILIEPVEDPKDDDKQQIELYDAYKSIQGKIDSQPKVKIPDNPILNLPEGNNGEEKEEK